MDKKRTFERYLVLYLPWVLALLFQSDPVLSYLIAWLGSLLILYLTMSGWVKPIPEDRSIPEQLMRPIFLVQIIFTGYMAVSSIFYFLNVLGFEDFHTTRNAYFSVDQESLELTALCQRYYVLGHAAFVTGVTAFMKYPVKQKYYIEKEKLANILLITALIALLVSTAFTKIPGLSQFYYQFNSLSFIAGTLALAFAIPLRKLWNTIFCAFLYGSNFYRALTSGFKEPIIISVLVLGVFLYPNYKKLVIVIFVPALLLLFALLPTFNAVFRANNWADNVDADDAYQLALDATINSNQSPKDNTEWGFLAYRLSEIDMFTTFVKTTPSNIDFYGFQLLQQSAIAVIPRIFWPAKPITEELAMERVYDAGVVQRGSSASAKTAFIVDAYLSDGTLGIFIALFLYGAIAQLISLQAEYLFGGYILGTALIFTGLFQVFWRGLNFEFLVNAVFWSYISMLGIFRVLRAIGILKEI